MLDALFEFTWRRGRQIASPRLLRAERRQPELWIDTDGVAGGDLHLLTFQ